MPTRPDAGVRAITLEMLLHLSTPSFFPRIPPLLPSWTLASLLFVGLPVLYTLMLAKLYLSWRLHTILPHLRFRLSNNFLEVASLRLYLLLRSFPSLSGMFYRAQNFSIFYDFLCPPPLESHTNSNLFATLIKMIKKISLYPLSFLL
jgi:hypothetical protein